jgi:predicted ester cyclase
VEPTGQEITVTEIAVYRIADGKVAEMWLEADLWGMFQQIGAVDPPEG